MNFTQDSLIINLVNMINPCKPEVDISDIFILEKNIQSYVNLNPVNYLFKQVNFNLIVLGESSSGKSPFIDCSLKKISTPCNNSVSTNKSSTDEDSDYNIIQKNPSFNLIEKMEEKSGINKYNYHFDINFITHSVFISNNKSIKFNRFYRLSKYFE